MPGFRNRAVVAALIALAGLCGACSSIEDYDYRAEWHGQVEVIQGGRKVLTSGGSLWQRRATLLESAVIGKSSGSDEDILQDPTGVAVDTTRERILILDFDARSVRVFDYEGHHLFSAGGRGQGPGEFSYASRLAVDSASGAFFVFAYNRGLVLVYGPDGVFQESVAVHPIGLYPPTIEAMDDGRIYVMQVIEWEPGSDPVRGLVTCWPSNADVDTLVQPQVDGELAVLTSERHSSLVPFWPERLIASSATRCFVAGFADHYAFTIFQPDGTRILVAKAGAPIPVQAEEAAWHHRYQTLQFQRSHVGWQWNSEDIPESKPAYELLYMDPDRRVWVHREGRGIRLASCIDHPEDLNEAQQNPCWESPRLIDVFDASGRYLGPFDPGECALGTYEVRYAHGDLVIVESEALDGSPQILVGRIVLHSGED